MSKIKQDCVESTQLSLADTINKIVCWIKVDALPLWSQIGVSRSLATSYKGLIKSSNTPKADSMSGWHGCSQAQMVYILSQAKHLGWLQGDESGLVNRMIEFSGRHGVLPCRSDGFVHHLNPDLTIADSQRLLLDHSYFMMASTASFVAYDVGNDLRRAYNIMHWLDIKMTHPDGGWCHQYGEVKTASSEAYLHCLQSFLYLFEVTKKPCWLERAGVVYDIFVEHFFDPENLTIHCQMIDEIEGVRLGDKIVPISRVFCWVWLLRRYQHLMSDIAGDLIGDIANQLYSKAKSTLIQSSDQAESIQLSCYILASSFQAQSGCSEAESDLIWAINQLFKGNISDTVFGWCADKPSSNIFTTNSFFFLFEAVREAYLYINPEEREVPLREVGGL